MEIRPLSSKLQKIAEVDLNEVPSRVLEDLNDIEEWLQKQPHLNVRKDRQWLLAFLRSSKFSLQRTKEKLDYFYTIKSITPELFGNKDPQHPEMQEIMKQGAAAIITKSTAEGVVPTILFINWKYADPNKISFASYIKSALMYMDILLNEDDNFSVNGIYIVHDVKAFSFGYLTHLTPALCKKAMISITKAYPARIKGIYFFNAPAMFETFLNMFMPFLSSKIKDRLKVFGEDSFDKLTEIIPLSVFPKEYSGEGQSYEEVAAESKSKMESYQDWFLEDIKYCSDESKRLGKPKTSADIFGVEGSFRKLNVD